MPSVHPRRGQILLLCTDLTLAAAEIIRLYALRFKIEVSFKQALHSVGTWAYHFWMRPMTPLHRFQGDQFLHHQSAAYRTGRSTMAVAVIGFLKTFSHSLKARLVVTKTLLCFS